MQIISFQNSIHCNLYLFKIVQGREGVKKNVECRPEDALVKLVKTVEIVETAETARTAHNACTAHPARTANSAHPTHTDHFNRVRYL